MNRIFFLLGLIFLVSCLKETKNVNAITDEDSASVTSQEVKINEPTKDFNLIVQLLDSLGYRGDTARVKNLRNYPELVESRIVMMNNFPFYKIEKEKSKLFWWNTLAQEASDSIDIKVFNRAIDVWAFFYRYGQKENTNFIVDGVIEQWKFSNPEDASTALNKLKSFYPLPYFNTEPLYSVKGNFLYIFYTRASAFSDKQKEFFKSFGKITSTSK